MNSSSLDVATIEVSTCRHSILVAPLLVAGSVQENQAKNVQVPHAVHPGEEAARVLEGGAEILVPLVRPLGHLADDEADDGEGGSNKGGQHQKLEPPDYTLEHFQ